MDQDATILDKDTMVGLQQVFAEHPELTERVTSAASVKAAPQAAQDRCLRLGNNLFLNRKWSYGP